MDIEYFNFSSKYAQGWWDRSSFVRHWWRLYGNDPRWVPPYYPAFRRSLEPGHNPHLNRLEPCFLTIEAMPRRQPGRRNGRNPDLDLTFYPGGAFEQTVATAVLLRDPRRLDRVAYLGILHCTNDADSLERMVEAAAFQLAGEGFNRLVPLNALSPYLGSGFLQDHWDEVPPIGTPYDPPYLLELFERQLNPGPVEYLYQMDVPSPLKAVQETIVINPLNPHQLAEGLLPLFLAGLPVLDGFPEPDFIEARFLVEWVIIWPVEAWLAKLAEKEVGFILLGPDLAPALLRTQGGKSLISRLRLKWLSRQPTNQGRIYFGGVLPEYRQKGIGNQLLQRALSSAQEHGWEQLVFGPIPENSPTAHYLEGVGARRGASYRHFFTEI